MSFLQLMAQQEQMAKKKNFQSRLWWESPKPTWLKYSMKSKENKRKCLQINEINCKCQMMLKTFWMKLMTIKILQQTSSSIRVLRKRESRFRRRAQMSHRKHTCRCPRRRISQSSEMSFRRTKIMLVDFISIQLVSLNQQLNYTKSIAAWIHPKLIDNQRCSRLRTLEARNRFPNSALKWYLLCFTKGQRAFKDPSRKLTALALAEL